MSKRTTEIDRNHRPPTFDKELAKADDILRKALDKHQKLQPDPDDPNRPLVR